MPASRPNGCTGRRHAVSWALVWGLVAATTANAQQASQPLSLEDCIRLAMESPSPVQIANYQSEIAAHSFDSVRAGLYPRAQADVGFIYNSPLKDSSDIPSFVSLDGVRVYDALVTVVEELDLFGSLRSQVNSARADRDSAAARLALSRRDLRRSVTGAYYRLLLSRRLVQVAMNSLDEAQSFQSRTELMFDQGEAARADVVKASAQTAFLEQTLEAARLEARLANQELASFWTTNVDGLLNIRDVLDGSLPPPPEKEEEAEATYLRRGELYALDADRRGFLADSQGLRKELYPRTSLVFQLGLNSQQFDFSDFGYAAFFNLSIPIFDWNRIRNTASQFELRARQVETDRAIAERTLSLEYYDALARTQMIYAQIESARTQVSLSQEDLRLSRIRYEGGEGPALDVVAAQNQLTLASSNYYSTVARYLTSLADLEVASGR
jgi:outer membrane protein TolC